MSRPAVLHVNRCPCTSPMVEYERRVTEWLLTHPDATEEQREEIRQKIAEALGI